MPSTKEYLNFILEQYEGTKEMLLVDNVDDKVYLAELFEAMYDDLPMPKIKKR